MRGSATRSPRCWSPRSAGWRRIENLARQHRAGQRDGHPGRSHGHRRLGGHRGLRPASPSASCPSRPGRGWAATASRSIRSTWPGGRALSTSTASSWSSWSSSSPPTRTLRLTTMPPRLMTATSVVPPPMSTMRLPLGSLMGSPAPMAAAMGSSMSLAQRAPASRGISDGAALHLRHAGRDAQQHARARHETDAVVHALHEVLDHLLGDVEVADDAVTERTPGVMLARCGPALRLAAGRSR